MAAGRDLLYLHGPDGRLTVGTPDDGSRTRLHLEMTHADRVVTAELDAGEVYRLRDVLNGWLDDVAALGAGWDPA